MQKDKFRWVIYLFHFRVEIWWEKSTFLRDCIIWKTYVDYCLNRIFSAFLFVLSLSLLTIEWRSWRFCLDIVFIAQSRKSIVSLYKRLRVERERFRLYQMWVNKSYIWGYWFAFPTIGVWATKGQSYRLLWNIIIKVLFSSWKSEWEILFAQWPKFYYLKTKKILISLSLDPGRLDKPPKTWKKVYSLAMQWREKSSVKSWNYQLAFSLVLSSWK